MNTAKKTIFLAVDGSKQSMTVVRYVSESVSASESTVVIFQVRKTVPEVFYDLGKEPEWRHQIDYIRSWEKKQKEICAGFLKRAVEVFSASGFDEKSIIYRVVEAQEGIARDIISASSHDCDVLVFGRGRLATPLGGTASKILSKAVVPALWLVGNRPNGANILVAVDSSHHAEHAVDHVARLLNRDNNHIKLFHAIRGIAANDYEGIDLFPEVCRRSMLQEAEEKFRPTMQALAERLHAKGIDKSRVSSKIVTGVDSRAAAIVNAARDGRYGTIVVGRKGVTEVSQFAMGRVTNKLTQLADKQALCIVG